MESIPLTVGDAMYLGRVQSLFSKVKGKSISKPLGGTAVPKRIDEREIPDLIRELKTGNKVAETRLIEGLMGYAIHIVSIYSNYLPIRYKDTLISEALLAVVKGVNLAKVKLVDDNIKSFVMQKV